jgi:geranylgeranyl pyrophosphate synthase
MDDDDLRRGRNHHKAFSEALAVLQATLCGSAFELAASRPPRYPAAAMVAELQPRQ